MSTYIDLDPALHKVPPHSIEAERAVIGCLLLENSAVNDALLALNADGRDFYHTAHRSIFQSILKLIDNGKVADLITVCEELRSHGVIDNIGGEAFVVGVADGAISAVNVCHYAEIVKGHAIRRQIITEATKLIQAAYTPACEVRDALEHSQKAILSLSIHKEKSTLRSARELAKQVFSEIEAKHKNGDMLTGIPTGLKDIDNLILGLNQGDLIIIAGRPAMGKSALAGNIARSLAMKNKTVAIFSLEMPGSGLMMRFLSEHTGIDSRHLRRGLVTDNQWPKLVDAASELSDMSIFIDENPDLTPMELRARARQIKAAHGLDLLILDYMQLMQVTSRHETREQDVSEISRTLKAIAGELSIPVIGLSQLNRQVENRDDKRPRLSDLRESGAIEQDADIIAFIYRDELYDKRPENPNRGIAEIEIAKHRNGPTGRVKVRFDAERTKFFDLG